MTLTKDFLDAVAVVADRSRGPLVVPWPVPGNLSAVPTFATFGDWQEFVLRFSLHNAIPQIVTAKFERAQELHLLAWIDFDLIKAGELVALTALELALQDRYGGKVKDLHRKAKGRNPTEPAEKPAQKNATQKPKPVRFADLLKYIAEHDALTDDKVPMIHRCGGSVVGRLTGERKPSLADIRNDLAHGYPFNSNPQAGLLELVRDLIEYAYRDMIAVA